MAPDLLKLPPFELRRGRAFVLRSPIVDPVVTSFGVMKDRPAVLVCLEDDSGTVGWGEIWCNFPGVGAEHRARVFESCVLPLLVGKRWVNPAQAFETVSRHLEVLAIQCGEPGPIAQAIAGADIAMWDLIGKKLGQPIWELLGGRPDVSVYASGLNPWNAIGLATAKLDEGYRACKIKVGFGREQDVKSVSDLRKAVGDTVDLMADANQGWDFNQAVEMCQRLEPFELSWMEEPLRADSCNREWAALADSTNLKLAAGENLRGSQAFAEALETGALSVVQPDLGKWGGFSRCVNVGSDVVAAGKMFCPHWLGGGVGLIAAMHLKAAVGGTGYVEVDANPNPLRDALANPPLPPRNGRIELSRDPGLGVDIDERFIQTFSVPHRYGN